VKAGDWLFSQSFRDVVQVVEVTKAFGAASVRVWHPVTQRVAVVASTDLVERVVSGEAHGIIASAAAARIKDALASGALLAPTQSVVEPLPHQLRALSRCVATDSTRMLLADEVGLGKTIEAGLVIAELILRGLARRVLIVAPKGLVGQWQGELRRRFNEEFVAFTSGEVGSLAGRREDNFWLAYDRVIVPLDAVKPLDKRRGWSTERVDQYNVARSTNLAAAGWDIVVIDEAHRVAGYSDQVARHRLATLLAESTPNLLLLTATPHVGHSEGFRRVLALLDEQEFLGDAPITPGRIQPYVVRTSKRVAIDGNGKPLFKPRTTKKVVIDWPIDRPRQRRLYDEITAYVREGYDLGRREKNNSMVFLMLLMQRLVSSSTRAIEVALQRRLTSLRTSVDAVKPADEPGQLRLDDDFWEADPNDQLELVFESHLPSLRQEVDTVERLLRLASESRQEGNDAKLEHLYELMVDVSQEENDPLAKLLVFTEFLPTQAMIVEYLRDMGVTVAVLNGGLSVEEREAAQADFEGDARVLVSTEAGGEGLNLQIAHLVVNFDIPWNPMRIEQRIGRVDRIGQTHPVRAFNLVLRDSVEDRVHDVLEVKLARILQDFGVDKLSDVLDSSAFEEAFQRTYADAMRGLDVDEITSIVATEVEQSGEYLRDWRDLLGGEMPDPAEARAMRDHPMPRWVERMTLAGALAQGGAVQPQTRGWQIEWQDGRSTEAAFRREDAVLGRPLLTLGDERVAAILNASTARSVETALPRMRVDGLAEGVTGFWSLWLIIAHAGSTEDVRALPVFHDTDGVLRSASARAIWDRLMERDATMSVLGTVDSQLGVAALARGRAEAELQGRETYEQLRIALQSRLQRRRDRFLEYIERRRAIVDRVGLENVRKRRLAELDRERERELVRMPMIDVAPELRCVSVFELVA
jgi:superfamily II DNA or RNA helicase